VDDEIAHLQIAQIGKECLREIAALLRRPPFLLEDVGFDVELQRRVGKPESARQRADRYENGRGV
jgi:hypothetical protein